MEENRQITSNNVQAVIQSNLSRLGDRIRQLYEINNIKDIKRQNTILSEKMQLFIQDIEQTSKDLVLVSQFSEDFTQKSQVIIPDIQQNNQLIHDYNQNMSQQQQKQQQIKPETDPFVKMYNDPNYPQYGFHFLGGNNSIEALLSNQKDKQAMQQNDQLSDLIESQTYKIKNDEDSFKAKVRQLQEQKTSINRDIQMMINIVKNKRKQNGQMYSGEFQAQENLQNSLIQQQKQSQLPTQYINGYQGQQEGYNEHQKQQDNDNKNSNNHHNNKYDYNNNNQYNSQIHRNNDNDGNYTAEKIKQHSNENSQKNFNDPYSNNTHQQSNNSNYQDHLKPQQQQVNPQQNDIQQQVQQNSSFHQPSQQQDGLNMYPNNTMVNNQSQDYFQESNNQNPNNSDNIQNQENDGDGQYEDDFFS